MTYDVIELSVCQNCLIAEANGDYSGMSDEEYNAVTAGLHNILANAPVGSYFALGGEELGFDWDTCECCEDRAGERYRLNLMVPQVGPR